MSNNIVTRKAKIKVLKKLLFFKQIKKDSCIFFKQRKY